MVYWLVCRILYMCSPRFEIISTSSYEIFDCIRALCLPLRWMSEISCTFETSCGIMLGWGTFAIGCVSPECFAGLQDIQCSYHLSQHQCNVLWYVFVVCVHVRCASRDWGMNALTKPKNQIHSILMTSASSLPIYQILIYLQLPSSLALCPEHVSVRWSATVGSSPWYWLRCLAISLALNDYTPKYPCQSLHRTVP